MARAPQAASRAEAPAEILAGLVEWVVFHNPENGFCVLRVEARGHREPVTLVGHAALISAGEFIQASGSWANDRTHGVQFRAAFLKATQPTSREAIEKYLGSRMIRGIGPVYAKKLVEAFGDGVFEVIENNPGRLRRVPGIGAKRAKQIAKDWAEQRAIREIMLFLHDHGVGTARAVRIYKTYGADALQLISQNPYRLARDIRGIGFASADTIAMRFGIDKSATIRVRAGISHALAEAMDDGHCGLPAEELIPLADKLLEVPPELIEAALAVEIESGAVVADEVEGRRCLFLAALHLAERDIAEKVKTLAAGKPPWPELDADKAIPWVERAAHRPRSRRQPERGDPDRARRQGAGHHRRPRGRQDDAGQFALADPHGEKAAGRARRPDRARRQAPRREHRPRGDDDPPPAGSRSRQRRLPPRRTPAAASAATNTSRSIATSSSSTRFRWSMCR